MCNIVRASFREWGIYAPLILAHGSIHDIATQCQGLARIVDDHRPFTRVIGDGSFPECAWTTCGAI